MGDMALAATGGTRPGHELLPWHLARRPRNRASPLYFPPRFGRALYLPGIRWHSSLYPKTGLSQPAERPGAAGELGGRAAPRGGRPAGPPAGEGAPRAAPPATQVRCPPGGRGGQRRPPPPAPAGRTATFPGAAEGTPAASPAPLSRKRGLTETQFPPPPAWQRLPRHHLAASGSALLAAPGNFPPPAHPSRTQHSPAPALPPPSHLRSAGGAESAAIPSAPSAPGAAVSSGSTPVGSRREAGVSRVPAAKAPRRCLRVCVRGGAARSRPPPARLPPGLLAPGRAVT